MENKANPRFQLEAEFLKRRAKNTAYSMRAFAKLLDLPSGRLSQLLSEKRRFTIKTGEKIASRLNLDPREKANFLGAILAARAPQAEAGGERLSPPAKQRYRALDMNTFRLIAEPLHFSLLSLLETTDCDGRAGPMAARLGVSVVEARAALRRLEEAGLISLPDGRAVLSGTPGLTTSHDISSAALRLAHARVLEETLANLDSVPVEARDVTSITLAIDPARLPEAKRRIREFRRELGAFLEGGARREVYRVNIQVMPVSKGKK